MHPTINVGLSSYGMSGKVFHGPLLKANPNFTVSHILERSKDRSASDFPEATIIRSYDELLANPEVELIVVNTPSPLHYQMTKSALLARKHVVVEKPFAVSTAQCEELIQLAQEKNKHLFVYHNRRFDCDFLLTRELIERKKFGDIYHYEVHFDRFRPNLSEKVWKESEELGGGTLYDLGSHLIDQALTLFGKPQAVFCNLLQQRPASKTTDGFDLNLRYGHNQVWLRASSYVRHPGPRIQIHGTNGSLIKYGADPQEQQLIQGILPTDEGYGVHDPALTATFVDPEGQTALTPPRGCYDAFYQNVADVLHNRKSVIISPGEAKDVIRVIELAHESHVKGAVIHWSDE